ncbi:unnamed protein product, partial [Amoebophrya sp. A120]
AVNGEDSAKKARPVGQQCRAEEAGKLSRAPAPLLLVLRPPSSEASGGGWRVIQSPRVLGGRFV